MRDNFGSLPIVAGMGFTRGIMLLDDCEGTFTYQVTGTGGDDVHEYATAAAWQGSYGLHLRTRVTAAAQNDILTVLKQFDFPESGLLVARLRLAVPTIAAVTSIGITLGPDDGVRTYTARLTLRPLLGTAAYWSAAGAHVAIGALAMTWTALQWYTVELAIDLLTKQYLHAFCNGVRVSLAGLAFQDAGASAGRCATLQLSILADAAPPAEMYADNLYVGEYLEA